MTIHFKHGVTWAIAFSLMFAAISTAVLTFGPEIETKFFPVIRDVNAQLINVDGDRNAFHVIVTGKKERNCSWENVSAETETNNFKAAAAVYFSDPTHGNPVTDVPAHQIGSQFLAEMFIFPVGDVLRVKVQHRCHSFWQSATNLYEIDTRYKYEKTN